MDFHYQGDLPLKLSERRAIVRRIKGGSGCPTCGILGTFSSVSRKGTTLWLNWRCTNCGHRWSNFYLNKKWGYYDTDGILESLRNEAKKLSSQR